MFNLRWIRASLLVVSQMGCSAPPARWVVVGEGAASPGGLLDPELPPSIVYELAPSADEVAVTVELDGEEDGETELGLGAWAAIDEPSLWLSGLSATADHGPVEIEVKRFGLRPKSRWRVRHDPGARLRVHYIMTPPTDAPIEERHLVPRISASLFRGVGNVLLMTPVGEVWEPARRIGFRWRVPAEIGVASSFGAEREGAVDLTLDDFIHAFFMAGPDVRWVSDDGGERGLRLAISGSWTFEDEAFLQQLGAVMQAQSELVQDEHASEQAPFVVSFAPYAEPPAGYSFAGTGLTDSFLAVATPQASLDPEQKGGRRLYHLLAHEMFHEVNGRRIGREQPEQLVYWFSEGFTELMAFRSLVRAEIFDAAVAAEEGRALMEAHRSNPARELPNADIVKRFWTDAGARRIPYQRGFVVGMWLDGELRRRGIDRGVDAFMAETLRAADEHGERVTVERLLDRIETMTSTAFVARIRDVVVDGEMPPAEAFDALEGVFTH